jgi:cell division septum initiation protein DivIVA
VTDSAVKGRVKGILGGPLPVNEPMEQRSAPPGPTAQHQAVQVLTLAQRTAEEHVAGARREADRVCADARAAAEQIVRDARAHVQVLQKESEKALADAHATAAQMARDAQARTDNAQRNAEEILSGAQTRADELAKNAQANADELRDQARQRYEDVVGSLAAKREALQQQIEALEQFDADYRARLTTFMQNQLRALWVDEPRVNAEDIEEPDSVTTIPAIPEQAKHSDGS